MPSPHEIYNQDTPSTEISETTAIEDTELIDTDAPDTSEELSTEKFSEKDEETVAYAKKFLMTVSRLKGVEIDREHFLKAELKKKGVSEEVIQKAIDSTPAKAGVPIDIADSIAKSAIEFETRKSSALSFGAGLPGGFAMLATVPADVTQYYVHAFRVMQKIAYIYGWQSFLDDIKETDDETLGKLASFLGVMLGVGGASNTLSTFATNVATPAIQKNIANKALTKTFYYTPIKKTLNLVGVKVTKDSFAKSVTKTVPVVSGVISGGMTYASLKSQSTRLMKHLKGLPPAWADGYVPEEFIIDEEQDNQDKNGKVKALKGKVSSKIPTDLSSKIPGKISLKRKNK